MESPAKKPKLVDSRLEAIRHQVEFYFSDVNLRHDSVMSDLTGSNKKSSFLRGTTWVLAKELMSFNRMKQLNTNIEEILDAIELGSPTLLEVDREEKRIRRFKPVPLEELEKDTTPCTIYVEGFPLDTSQDFIREKFSQHGQVNYVSLPHFSETHPIHYQRSATNCPLSQGYAFVEFSQPHDARAAYQYYNRSQNPVYTDQTFFPRVMLKATWLEYLNRYNKIQKIGYRQCRQTIVIKSR